MIQGIEPMSQDKRSSSTRRAGAGRAASTSDWTVLDAAGLEFARLRRVQQTCVRRLSHALFNGTLPKELQKLTPAQLNALNHLLAI
jgi:hypothetical protein